MEKIRIEAFLGEQRKININTNDHYKLASCMRGYKLDEIQISATLKTEADIEKLMALLSNFQPCLKDL